MDDKEARLVLSLRRADDVDDSDLRFLEAQKLAENNPSLARWWATEKELDEIISEKLMSAPVPAGLKQRILSQSPAPVAVHSRWLRPVLIAAACLVLLAVFFGSWRGLFQPAASLADYRGSMVEFIDRWPPLALETSDLSQITQFLQEKHELAFEIPSRIRELKPVGCRTLQFNGHDVALVCFRNGNGKYAHLFVMKADALPALPGRDKPNYSTSGKWMTASWKEGGQAYLVLVEGDRAQLEQLVGTS